MRSLYTELERYRPALVLDRVLPRRVRRIVTIVLASLLGLCACVVLYYVSLDFIRSRSLSFSSLSNAAAPFLGGFLALLPFWLALRMLTWFYNTFYFSGIEDVLKDDDAHTSGITFEVAHILSKGDGDLTRGLLRSIYGETLMLRLGIAPNDIDTYLVSARAGLPFDGLSVPEHGVVTLEEVGTYCIKHDPTFKEFLFAHAIPEELYSGALAFVARRIHEEKRARRWWSRDNLGKINGLGKDFSYGVAYNLQKYVRSLSNSATFSSLGGDITYTEEKMSQIETVLSRAQEANVLLVGEAGAGTMDLLVALNRKIQQGTSVASVLGKHLMVFDWEAFIADHSTKQQFEPMFMRTFDEATRAGNIVIVIDNLAKFFTSAEALGVDVSELLNRYLTSSELQIVATSDPRYYHQSIEIKPQLTGRFSVVYIESPNLSGVRRVLEDVVLIHEAQHGIFFTYPALAAIAESADRYIVEGVMPDKAVDLLIEIAPAARGKGVTLVTKEFIETFVSAKTGIPSGTVTASERDTLLNLEQALHARVIGQEQAVTAIANAMRRARAGVQSSKRPMGSFLFLGSTGVGKTETAKALAAIFFNDESKMSRIDMSEYSGDDGLSRLMGDATHPGVLPTMLREHPYGVLLLDEFEKTSRDVHNLFLQILDEGVFTDGRGERVNARNAIIIATSNAGSQMIWDMVGKGENPVQQKDQIVDAIVHDGLYAPELINRFDGVIIFEPLKEENQKKIAGLMLEELRKRVKEKGYELVVNDALLSSLVAEGYNPQFGARPMRRLIQDIVEEKIAEKIIAGSLALGDKIEFTATDFIKKP